MAMMMMTMNKKQSPKHNEVSLLPTNTNQSIKLLSCLLLCAACMMNDTYTFLCSVLCLCLVTVYAFWLHAHRRLDSAMQSIDAISMMVLVLLHLFLHELLLGRVGKT